EVDDQIGDEARNRHAANRRPDVLHRDVPPAAVVEAGEDEDAHLHRDDDQDRPVEDPLVRLRGPVVEAELEGEEPGERDEAGIGGELPEPVAVERHARATRAASASRTTATTRSCCSGAIDG